MPESSNTAAKVANYLLQTQAVKLSPNQPFTWTSGWKSPIYCDNRVTLSYPEVRRYITLKLAERILDQFGQPHAIVGIATAGIPQGAWVAEKMDLPFAYVRSEAKKHGMGRQLEGDIPAGSKIVLIEDLVSTGKSSLAAVEVLRELGYEVVGLAAVFTYGFAQANDAFAEINCPWFALSNYDELIQQALQLGVVKSADTEALARWRRQPDTWGQ